MPSDEMQQMDKIPILNENALFLEATAIFISNSMNGTFKHSISVELLPIILEAEWYSDRYLSIYIFFPTIKCENSSMDQ